MIETQPYMVVWTTRKTTTFSRNEKFKDHWVMVDSLAMAEVLFSKLTKKPKTFVASIVAVVESTDYTSHPSLLESLPL
jgi:hypothetical protein